MDQKRKNQPFSNSTNKSIDDIRAMYGMIPPQAVELEEAILGACMLERDAYYKISDILTKEMFYKDEHQKVFGVIENMTLTGKVIDLLTVTQQFMQLGILDEIGGPLYITQLTSRVASAAHIENHARIIYEKYVLRESISRFQSLMTIAYNDDFDEFDLAYAMNTQAIDDLMAGKTGMRHIREVMKDTSREVSERVAKAECGEMPGISTGLADLNRCMNGWQPSDLIVIAARPGMGKTAFALHFAKASAIKNTPVCIFSLEMSDTRLSQRLILSNGGIESDHIKSGKMTPEDWSAFHKSVGQLETLPIYIDDTAAASLRYISAVARNKARRNECSLIVIDYLQLVESPQENGYASKNREREVAEISRGLKKLAKETNVPVILLAQLNRGVESRADKTPMLSDLRESGAIEQDADMVIFPWRPEYYDPDGIDENGVSIRNLVQLVIAKNREGDIRTITCKKSADFSQIFDMNPNWIPDERYEKEGDKF
jgi:replicative DNA helicase